MRSRDPVGRMWADACELLDQAERLHRQFFRLDVPRGTRAVWAPPVDVLEDERDLVIVVALPGVRPNDAEAAIEGNTLVVRAERRMLPDDRDLSIHRLEIPHGYFERRLALPTARFETMTREWRNGCLVITLRKKAI
jgi:HSP20 family protein